MRQVTDAEIAAAVEAAVKALNRTLAVAQEAGLRVDVRPRVLNACTYEKPDAPPLWTVEVGLYRKVDGELTAVRA